MTPFIFFPNKLLLQGVEVGDGLSVRRLGGVAAIGRIKKKNGFNGAWAVEGVVDAGGVTVTVSRGYVNAMEPVVGGVPISGIMPDGSPSDEGQPILKTKSSSRVYVCLKITPNKDGKIINNTKEPKLAIEDCLTIELIDGEGNFRSSGDSWYQPLAVFDQNGMVSQLAYFDYFYQAYKIRSDDNWHHRLTVS